MFLLDTNVFIRYQLMPNELSKSVLEILTNRQNNIFISPVVAWEIAIKTAKGKLQIAKVLLGTYSEILEEMQLKEIPITGEHAILAGQLPAIHQDPFDRLIIAQASLEKLTILTADRAFSAYGIAVIN